MAPITRMEIRNRRSCASGAWQHVHGCVGRPPAPAGHGTPLHYHQHPRMAVAVKMGIKTHSAPGVRKVISTGSEKVGNQSSQRHFDGWHQLSQRGVHGLGVSDGRFSRWIAKRPKVARIRLLRGPAADEDRRL